jgi:pyruvate/2-oxoglutarate dehydrogenase complex dihydrolipoamide acyltransferase (E2) component
MAKGRWPAPEGRALSAPVAGTVSSIAAVGERLPAGAVVAVVEAMKMEHEVIAEAGGEVTRVDVAVGDTVTAGQAVAAVAAGDAPPAAPFAAPARAALDEVLARHEAGRDAARPDAVAKRREQGRRTARENLADLVDDGTLVEYGPPQEGPAVRARRAAAAAGGAAGRGRGRAAGRRRLADRGRPRLPRV